MFDRAGDPTGVLEEREVLQQMVSLGVKYSYGRSWIPKTSISDSRMLHSCISRMPSFGKYPDESNIIREAQSHIRNGDNGYYLVDLHEGRILAGERYSIVDIIIDFTLAGADEGVLLRKRKGTCLHGTEFLIMPGGVYFLGVNRVYIPLTEFHLLSFISLDDNSRYGFVVDYDATQNNRPTVLFPCEENNDIIQSQLSHDDQCCMEEYKSLIRDIDLV